MARRHERPVARACAGRGATRVHALGLSIDAKRHALGPLAALAAREAVALGYRAAVRSRAVLSRANRSYVICRAVVCRVSPNGVRFELLVPGMPWWARTICHGI